MPASIIFDQTGASAGVAGQARNDFDVGIEVTCSNATVATSYLWTLVDVPIRSALTRGLIGTSATFAFTPDVKGTYVVTLRINGSFFIPDNAKSFCAVLSTELGWRYKGAREGTEDNILYAGLGFTGNINTRGWATPDDLEREEIEAAVYVVQNAVSVGPSTGGQLVFTDSGTGIVDSSLLPATLQLTSSAPEDVTKATAVIGVATTAARSDHKHNVSTAVPVDVGTANSEGTATSLARSDHVHAGLALTSSAPEDVTKATAVVGVSTTAARADHKHNISTAAPVSVGTANSEGTATSLARSDHVHSGLALTSSAPANVTKATATVGVDTTAARSDHKHDITTAAPVSIGTANSEGSATSLARSDHVHSGLALTSSAPANVTKATAVVGVDTTAARSDHKHDITTATAVSVGTANAEGTSTSISRADHVHNHGTQTDGTHHAGATTTVAGFLTAALFIRLTNMGRTVTVPNTTYTFLAADIWCKHMCTNAAGCTITIPQGTVQPGEEAYFTQMGAAQINLDGVAVTPVTIRKTYTAKSEKQYATIGILGTQTTNEVVATGQVAST